VDQAGTVRTARLLLRPVGPEHLPQLEKLKADPRVFATMLGGVRAPERTRAELVDDMRFWAERGYGMWVVHALGSGAFFGIAGLMERPDGRGVALRYAFWPETRGRGFAREAAVAALRFGHAAGLLRIVAVSRADNAPSCELLSDIGMRESARFLRDGVEMLEFESLP
jgi:RimJ/RimL family protein N-acetyltransferase